MARGRSGEVLHPENVRTSRYRRFTGLAPSISADFRHIDVVRALLPLRAEVSSMHSRWMMPALMLSACLTAVPLYADAHGRPPTAPGPHAPKAPPAPKTVKPATPGTTHATSPSPATSTTHVNPIAAKISAKPQLNARITALLPENTTLDQASLGFKNQGQFIAALHVSQNLGCDCFKQLQTDMTTKKMSLGQAIQDVKKTANSTTEAHHAETQADADIKAAATPSTDQNKKKPTHGGGDR
jgi:hypothetical protein